LFTGCFTWMFIVNSKGEVQTGASVCIERFLKYLVPAILLIVSYMTFHLEIVKYFDQLTIQTRINVSTRTRPAVYETNQDYGLLKTAWAYIYAMLFALLLTFLNIKKLKSHDLSAVIIVLNVLLIGAFLTQGLYNLSLLRDSYLLQSSKYFASGAVNIAVRYVSLVFFGLLLLACHRLTKSGLTGKTYRTSFDYLLYIALLWIISSEFINILALARLSGSYKLGISILWGVYAVFLIIMGLAKNKKHLRIGAIVLFGLTLLKLFFFDIAYLGTIAKTVVFVSLGVLLLIISFLYNKYKHLITDNARTED